jgi:hypothetical protein
LRHVAEDGVDRSLQELDRELEPLRDLPDELYVEALVVRRLTELKRSVGGVLATVSLPSLIVSNSCAAGAAHLVHA